MERVTHASGARPSIGLSRRSRTPTPIALARPTGLPRMPSDPTSHPGLLRSPMVGTAFRSPGPGEKPFVEVGDEVREGQPLMIVEAMKTMNQIPCPTAGRIAKILVEDGQPVEYDEPLLIIE